MRTGFPPFLIVFAGIVTVAANASAFGGTAHELEQQGNFVITNNADVNITHQFGPFEQTNIRLLPGLDYMVINNLSIGGAAGIQLTYDQTGQNTNTTILVQPRVGYEVALTETWSIWPLAGLDMGFPSQGTPTVDLALFVPILVHPTEHFFFGAGPGLQQGLRSNAHPLLLGALQIGGYFDH